MTCTKYAQKYIWKEHLCALQVFLRTNAHSLEGTLNTTHFYGGNPNNFFLAKFLHAYIKLFKGVYGSKYLQINTLHLLKPKNVENMTKFYGIPPSKSSWLSP